MTGSSIRPFFRLPLFLRISRSPVSAPRVTPSLCFVAEGAVAGRRRKASGRGSKVRFPFLFSSSRIFPCRTTSCPPRYSSPTLWALLSAGTCFSPTRPPAFVTTPSERESFPTTLHFLPSSFLELRSASLAVQEILPHARLAVAAENRTPTALLRSSVDEEEKVNKDLTPLQPARLAVVADVVCSSSECKNSIPSAPLEPLPN
jgi:hypothetical protein